MIVEFQTAPEREQPEVGSVLFFPDYEHTAIMLVSIGDSYALIDLTDGYQMWYSKNTIPELMSSTGYESWTILKNCKLIAK